MGIQLPTPKRFRGPGTLFLASLLISFVLVGCQARQGPSPEFPRRPIKVIVPFSAGGGSDTFGRIIQAAVDDHDLLPQTLVIINVPGAGGTIGSRRVKNAQPDGYTILLLHEGILTAKYSGQAAYGPEVFEPIAGTGNATQVIAVSDDSPFADLRMLMSHVANHPDEIVYAANMGAPSHFAGLMLEQQQPNAVFRYTQTGGGAKRFEAIKGRHAEVSSFSIAEYATFSAAGLRAIAVLSPDRHPDFPDLPTAREQGFDVVSENMQYWWAPRGTPENRRQVIGDAIAAAMQLPEVREKLANMRIDPVTLRGDELNSNLNQRSQSIAAVSQRAIEGLPDFPLITLLITIVLGIISCLQRAREGRRRMPSSRAHPDWVAATAVLLVTILYVASLQWVGAPFVAATALYVFAVGSMITSRTTSVATRGMKRMAPVLAVVAVSLSLGIHFVFTRILVVDLP